MHLVGFQELSEEGLVSRDEWDAIAANEACGMPSYMTVLYWIEVRSWSRSSQ
jgi:hypothetical protein